MNKTGSALLCERLDWQVGDKLIAEEGVVMAIIQITAIGDSLVLAKTVSVNGNLVNDFEREWELSHRKWRKAE